MQNSYESRDETDDYEDTVKLYAKVLNVEYTWPEWNKDRISSNRK